MVQWRWMLDKGTVKPPTHRADAPEMRWSSHQSRAVGALAFAGAVALLLAGVGSQKLKPHPPVMIRSSLLGIRPAPTKGPAVRVPASAAILRSRIFASAAAFRQVQSYTAELVETDRRGSSVATVEFSAPDRFHVTWMRRGRAVETLVIGSRAAYLRATSDYWSRSGLSARASGRLQGVWVGVGPVVGGRMATQMAALAPATLAYCMTAGTGTLTDHGQQSVGGQSATVVTDAGDGGSNARSRVYIAASGPPYPLRLVNTIKHRAAGAAVDPRCPPPGPGVTHQDLRYRGFNEPVSVAPPADPVDLSRMIEAAKRRAVIS